MTIRLPISYYFLRKFYYNIDCYFCFTCFVIVFRNMDIYRGYPLTFPNIYNVPFSPFNLFVLLHSVLYNNFFKPEPHDILQQCQFCSFKLHFAVLIYKIALLFDSISLQSSVNLCYIILVCYGCFLLFLYLIQAFISVIFSL